MPILSCPVTPRPATPAILDAWSSCARASRACCRNRAPASVTLTPVRCRSNNDTPSSSSSARTRRLTADCLMPNALAAPLKLKYLATTSACAMETELIVADFAVVPDDDLRCGMSTLFDTHYRRWGMMGSAAKYWSRGVAFKTGGVQDLNLLARSFLGGFRMSPVPAASSRWAVIRSPSQMRKSWT